MKWFGSSDFKREFEQKLLKELKYDPEAVWRDIGELLEKAQNGDPEAEEKARCLKEMYPLAQATVIQDNLGDVINPLVEAIKDSIQDISQDD
ncbi:MAG: hypothetical protein ACOH5I_26135 [Oligoflexus sp.]